MTISIKRFIPALDWMSRYQRADLRGDITAGLTTAVMLIPQGMAYAMLAGLPPIVGLYASIVPLILYALLGTSRQLAVGPVAMDSLLVAGAVAPLAAGDPERYIALAVTLALMVGVIQLAMGLLRMGFLVNLLSRPVVSGFTSAAAIVIGLSQLGHLLGVSLPRSPQVHTLVIEAVGHLGEIHPQTFALGALAVGMLLAFKRFAPALPRALVVVVLGTLAVKLLGLDGAGVKIVGEVPPGLPSLALPALTLADLSVLTPAALTIALVAFMEAISVGKAVAQRRGYEIDASQELIALGAANVGGALFQGYPVTGGFSRTAVNDQAGAKTPLASLITAGLIALTLLFLTPLFHFLPKAALAAIIMTAVFGLVNVQDVRDLYRVSRPDLAMLLLTFAATLTLGIQQGIAVGVVASLAYVVYKISTPRVVRLGRLPGCRIYRDIEEHPEGETWPGILAVRIDDQLYFGNVAALREALDGAEALSRGSIQSVLLDASGISRLDASGAEALMELREGYRARGIAFIIAGAKRPVRAVLDRAGITSGPGATPLYRGIDEAIEALVPGRTLPGEVASPQRDLPETRTPRGAGERATPEAACLSGV